MKINVNYLEAHPTNMWNRNGMKIEYIVVHYVGAVSTAKNNADYLHRDANLGWSAHYFVDEESIWQSVPLNMSAGHCGVDYSGGKAPYWGKVQEQNSIGIEMCCKMDKEGLWYIEPKTVDKTVELVKYLMETQNIPAANVLRHFDVCWKTCPEPWVRDQNQWYDFKKRLEVKPVETWEDIAIRKAKEYAISDGSRPEETCTRVEAMAMAERAADYAVKTVVEMLWEAYENMRKEG